MAMQTKTPKDSFRVPNSIIQGMTTSTMTGLDDTTGLNRLTAFQMVTLLGLLTRVPPRHAKDEVRSTVSEIMAIIKVSRRVAHAVTRQWTGADGRVRRKRYAAVRHSPKHLRMIHEALLALHGKTVLIRRSDPRDGRQVTERLVHLLDSFGYVYEQDGKELDLHDLPHGRDKVNVGTSDRPVWRVVQRTDGGERFDRATGILFRLNTELARELTCERGTIGYTLIARKVFALFKRYMKTPAAIRLIFLVLRQTELVFNRRLSQAADDLGFDITHLHRAVEQLTSVLASLKDLGLVNDFGVDPNADKIVIHVNRVWYQETEPAEAV